MQGVILAGGLATRLRPLTEQIPKCLIKIHGKPFMEYQIDLLRSKGIKRILLCLGYLSEQVTSYFRNGHAFGVQISYSLEDDQLLGTGGALRQAYPLLEQEVLLLYGDSYLEFSWPEMLAHFRKTKSAALMLVHRNQNQWDQSNVVLENGYVKIYDKKNTLPEMEYIDAGLSILKKEVIREIPPNQFYDLADFYQALARRKLLKAYEIQQRFYEVGSPAGLKEFASLVEQGGLP
jgi:NDP-sugar pyrophosphorylase family protein